MISDGAIILTTDPDPDPSISGLEMKFEWAFGAVD